MSADISLVFGVAGEGSISDGSGKLIHEQLTEIVSKINEHPLGIKFELDKGSAESIKEQLNGIVSGLGSISVDISKTTGVTNGIDSSLTSISDSLNEIKTNLSGVVTMLGKANATIDSLFSESHESSAGIAAVANELRNVLSIIEQINAKDFNIKNTFAAPKENVGTTFELYKNQATEFYKYIRGVSDAIAYTLDSGLKITASPEYSNVFRDMMSFSSKIPDFAGKIDAAKTTSELKKLQSGLWEAYKPLEKFVQLSGGEGVFKNMPDDTAANKAIEAVKSYTEQRKNLNDAYENAVMVASGRTNGTQPNATDELKKVGSEYENLSSEISTVIDTISARLDDLREKINDTFDFTKIHPDASSITSVIDDIKAQLESLDVKVSLSKVETSGVHEVSSMSEISRDASSAKTSVDSLRRSLKSLSDAEAGSSGASNAFSTLDAAIENISNRGNIKTDDLDSFVSAIDSVKDSITKVTVGWDNYKDEVANVNKVVIEYLDEQGNKIQQYFDVNEKFNKNGDSDGVSIFGGTTSVEDVKKDIMTISQRNDALRELDTILKNISSSVGIADSLTTKTESAVNASEGLKQLQQRVSSMSEDIGNGAIGNAKYAESLSEIRLATERYTTAIKSAQQEQKNNTKQSIEANRVLTDIETQIQKATLNVRNFSAAQSSSNKGVRDAYNSLSGYISLYKKLQEDIQKTGYVTEKYSDKLQELKRNTAAAVTAIKESGNATKSFGDKLSESIKKFASWFSMTQVVSKSVQYVRSMVTNTIELDKSMTQLKIVTNETADAYANYSNEIAKTAQEIGASITDLVDATTTYARLGYSLQESQGLAKVTAMLQEVGDIEAQDAQDAITAIIKAFSSEINPKNIDDIMAVGDKLVKVGNNFPISVSQIAEGINNAASALSASGNSFEESIALLTAATTVSQNASKASTGLRTISARIRNVKSELDDLGEAMTDAKYEEIVQALTDYNVRLTEANGEFRSTYDILSDIASQWNNMTNMEQSALATELAGNRQQEVFFSIIEQFQEASGAMTAMADSSNYLEQAYAENLEGVTAHINAFKAAFQQLSSDVMNSDTLKMAIDIGRSVLNLADSLARINMLLPTLIGMVGAIKLGKIGADAIALTLSSKKLAATLIESAKDATNEAVANNALKASLAGVRIEQEKYIITQIKQAVQNKVIEADQAEIILGMYGLSTAENTATTATNALTASFTALLSTTNIVGWIAIAIGLIASVVPAIKSASSDVDDTVNNIQSSSDKLKEVSDSIQKIEGDFASFKSRTDEIIPRFTELSKGVDQFGNNISLTDEEYSEFLDLNNELAEKFSGIDMGLDSNGNHMLKLDYTARDLTGTLYGLAEAQREVANVDISSKMDDALGAYRGVVEDSNKEIADYKNNIRLAKILLKNLNSEMTIPEKDSALFGLDYNFYDSDYGYISAKDAGKLKEIANALGVDYTSNSAGSNFGTPLERLLYSPQDILFGGDKEYVSSLVDKYINDMENAIKSVTDGIDESRNVIDDTITSWLNTDSGFMSLDAPIKDALTSIVHGTDWDSMGELTSYQIQDYIQSNIIDPIVNASPEVRNAISSFVDTSSTFSTGAISVEEYKSAIDDLMSTLSTSGMSDTFIESFMNSFGTSDITNKLERINTIYKNGSDGTEEYADNLEKTLEYINDLTKSDFDIAYNIISENGSMSLDDLVTRLEWIKSQSAGTSNPFDMSEFFEGLDSATKNVDKIVSALNKLKEGTALTKNELLQLAEQFPNLLKQSNLFTDGSIAGQKKMLDVILDSYEQEYDAQIDIKIRELKASVEAINAQIEIEQQKRDSILRVSAMLHEGKILQMEDYLKAENELEMLEGVNYAEIKNGELRVNQMFYEKGLAQGQEFKQDATDTVWAPYSNMVAAASKIAYLRSLEYTQDFVKDVYEAISNGSISMAEATLLSKEKQGEYVSDEEWNRVLNDYAAKTFGSSKMNAQTVNNWEYHYVDNINSKISELEKSRLDAENTIANLEALKKLTLDDVLSSTSGSSSSSSSTSDNVFKQLYEYHKHLVAMDEETSAEFLKWLKENYKDAYDQGLISLSEYYKYAEEVYSGENKLSEDAKKQFESFIDYRIKMLEKEQDAQKDNLNEQLKQLKDFYDKQKKMLQDAADEEKYLDDQSEKRNNIIKLEEEMMQLQYDTSAYANKRRIELQQEIADAEKELTDFEKDYALDKITNELDDAYEKEAARLQAEIDAIDNIVNDPNTLFNEALAEISGDAKGIYEQMVEYNQMYGDGKDDTITDMWDAMVKALKDYNLYFGKNYKGIDVSGYASGTSNATRGLHSIDEFGSETIFESADGTKYKMFTGGEMVLNSKASKFLFDFANNGSKVLSKMMKAASNYSVSKSSIPSVINMGDIVINGNTNERTVSEIRREQRGAVEFMLKEFAKLSK